MTAFLQCSWWRFFLPGIYCGKVYASPSLEHSSPTCNSSAVILSLPVVLSLFWGFNQSISKSIHHFFPATWAIFNSCVDFSFQKVFHIRISIGWRYGNGDITYQLCFANWQHDNTIKGRPTHTQTDRDKDRETERSQSIYSKQTAFAKQVRYTLTWRTCSYR